MTTGFKTPEKVIASYGTTLAETRKMVKELEQAVKRKQQYPFFPTPVLLSQDELAEYGIELPEPMPEGWLLKIETPVEGEAAEISFLTADRWQIKGEDIFISPEGEQFTRAELEALMPPEAPPAEVGVPEDYDAQIRAAMEEAYPGWSFPAAMTAEKMIEWHEAKLAKAEALKEPFETLFPGESEKIISWLAEQYENYATGGEEEINNFVGLLQKIGKTPETEAVLKTLGATDDQINEIFLPSEYEELGAIGKRIFNVAYAFSNAEGWHKYLAPLAAFPEVTGAMEKVGAAWEKYVNRPWLSLHLTGMLSHPETEVEWQANTIMQEAQEKYGWAFIFSPEVSQAWNMIHQDQAMWPELGPTGEVIQPGKFVMTGAKYTNPVYWFPVGKAIGSAANAFKGVPVLGRHAIRVAAAVQKAEATLAWPLNKAIQKAYVKTFTPVVKRELYKWAAGRGIVKLDPLVEDFAIKVALRYVGPGKLTRTAIRQMFQRRGLEYVATYAGETAASEAGANVARLVPLLGAGGMATAGATEETTMAIVLASARIIELNIMREMITASFIASFVPEGVTLEKTVSLIEQLKDMGHSAEAIDAMSAEEAWANLFKEVAPDPVADPVTPPKVDISRISDAEAREIVEGAENLFIDLPSQEAILKAALEPNWQRDLAQKIASLAGGERLINVVDPRLLANLEFKNVSDIIKLYAIDWYVITKMGSDVRAVKLNELQGITTRPVKLFKFDENAISTKMIKRLLPQHKGLEEAGTLEHVFTKPEMYDWTGFKKGLDYVTRTHELTDDLTRLAISQGVGPEGMEELGNRWWMHRVVEGKYDANGELMAIRGRPGMKGKWAKLPSYGMHRKAPTMWEGITWRIKYGANPETSIGTYIEEVFNQIAKKRYYEGVDKALEAIGKEGITPADLLKQRFPEIVDRAELTKIQLKDTGKFHALISRALRGEKITGQTLKAIERRFPDLGRRFKSLVQEAPTAERELRLLLKESYQTVRKLAKRLQTKKVSPTAIKPAKLPDELKLAEAFKVMSYEDRLAFRSTMDDQLEELAKTIYEHEMELAGIREFLKTDPVATYHGLVKGKPVPLTTVLRFGQFPETFSIDEAKMLMMGRAPKTIVKGRVPRSVVIDELADHFGITEQELIDQIESIRVQRETANDLVKLVRLVDGRLTDIKRMLEILNSVDAKPEFIPQAEVVRAEPAVPPVVTIKFSPEVEAVIAKWRKVFIEKGDLTLKQWGEARLELQRATTDYMMPMEALQAIRGVEPTAPPVKPEVAYREEMTLDEFKRTLDSVLAESIQEMKDTKAWLTKVRQRGYAAPPTQREIFEEQQRVEALELRVMALQEFSKDPEGAFLRIQEPEFIKMRELLLDRGRALKIIPLKPPVIPKAEPGMPEAGLQKDMFGFPQPVFPAGKGEITQISMEEYRKLIEIRKAAGLEGPQANIVVRPEIEGIKGLEPEAVSPKEQGIIEQIGRLKADLELTHRRIAKLRITAEKRPDWKAYDKYAEEVVGIKIRIEEQEAVRDLLLDDITKYEQQLAKVRAQAVPTKPGVVGVPKGLLAKITYKMPELKGDKERKALLTKLRDEVKALMEARKAPYWQAQFELAAKMEPLMGMTPEIGKGKLIMSHWGGRILDQDVVDAINGFFGGDKGSKFLKPIANFASIMRLCKATLDLSFHAIQGQPAFGLAFSYMMTDPKIGTKMMAEWFKAQGYAAMAYLEPSVTHRYLAKHGEAGVQRVSFGGSSSAIDYFEAMKGKGLIARALNKFPPLPRAELAFYGAGELMRNTAWEALSEEAIRNGKGFELAAFLDRMTGVISTQAMGVTPTIRQLESAFIWFAPRYTRACVTFMGNCFRGGYTGAQTRRAMAGMIMAAVLFYSGVQFAKSTLEGKDTEEAWLEVLAGFGVEQDPITGEWDWKPSARMMSFKIGNYYFGVGGFWYGMVRLFGNIMATIEQVGDREIIDFYRIWKYGSLNRRDNPFLAWWYNRASPFTGFTFEAGWPLIKSAVSGELASGRDFLGYPIESPWEYARYLITRFEPIWMEQGLNPYIPFFARAEEIPEGVARIAVPIIEIFGLRSFPESSWVIFYDKVNEILPDIPEDVLAEYYTDEEMVLILKAQSEGKLRWAHLTQGLKQKLLANYPELMELYEQAQTDWLVRSRPEYKQWKARLEEEKTIYYGRGNDLIGRVRDGELDTRELRDMWSDAGRNYGTMLDAIEKEPTYQDFYEYFDKMDKKGLRYDWFMDLARQEYIDIQFAEYIDEKGDLDWDAKDRAVQTYIGKWGEEVYLAIRQEWVDRKLNAGLDPALVRLAEDKDKLGREYWQLPYKPIYEMDEDDEVKGDIPAQFAALWKEYQALETDAEREAFLKAHPDMERDWRAEYRLANPEADAMLALWGYGGKIQTREAYDLVTKLGEELGIPLGQMGLGLPPVNLIDYYFDLNKIVADTSGNSVEARLYKLQHPSYLAWGLEQGIWTDDLSDEHLESLQLRVKFKAEFEKYDSIIFDNAAKQRDARERYLKEQPDFAEARRRVEAYSLDFPEGMISQYVDYYSLPEKGDWRDRYRLENPDFDKTIMGIKDLMPLEPDKVRPERYDQIYLDWQELFEAYESVTGTATQRDEARQEILKKNPTFARARLVRKAYEIYAPEKYVELYADYYSFPEAGWDRERFLKEHQDYYQEVWIGLLENDPIKFDRVPSEKMEMMLDKYFNLPSGSPRLLLRCKHEELDDYLIKVYGYKPCYGTWRCGVGEKPEGEEEPSYYEQIAEAEAIKQWMERQWEK